MTIEERFKYLRKMQRRYQQANRPERGRLLDEMEVMTGLDRKTLIRRMSSVPERKARQKQRERVYKAPFDQALRILDETFDHIAAERITPNLVWMAEILEQHGEMSLDDEVREQLARVSVSTVARRRKRLGQDEPHLPRKGPEQTRHLNQQIPMRRIPRDEPTPGHFEVDLVHHCGPQTSGEYIHTLQMVDVTTGWSERVAVLGRSYVVMEDAFQRILARLPFRILELHSDNGSEFLNAHLLRFFGERVCDMVWSRSRPWQKNDNRLVEERNDTLVRAYWGKERLDTVEQVLAMNALYERMGWYYHFFQPVLHLIGKEYLPLEGGGQRLRRVFDSPRTPFQRLCATGILRPSDQAPLEMLYETLNPRQLRRQIREEVGRILALPNATPGIPQDVYQSLWQHQLRKEEVGR